jgi:hypothetical protein
LGGSGFAFEDGFAVKAPGVIVGGGACVAVGDANGMVPELNEEDNIQLFEYTLGQGAC